MSLQQFYLTDETIHSQYETIREKRDKNVEFIEEELVKLREDQDLMLEEGLDDEASQIGEDIKKVKEKLKKVSNDSQTNTLFNALKNSVLSHLTEGLNSGDNKIKDFYTLLSNNVLNISKEELKKYETAVLVENQKQKEALDVTELKIPYKEYTDIPHAIENVDKVIKRIPLDGKVVYGIRVGREKPPLQGKQMPEENNKGGKGGGKGCGKGKKGKNRMSYMDRTVFGSN